MIEEIFAELRDKMDKAVHVAEEDFATVRTGRANPAMFHAVKVDYYGTPTPLQQLASFQNPEARTLIITPYDRSAMKDIENAIRDTPNLGVNPSNDGNVIRVVLPELTEERRREFVKLVRSKAEDARVTLRSLRRRAKDDLDDLKGEVGDDEISRAEKRLDAETKTFVEKVDQALERKEKELLEI